MFTRGKCESQRLDDLLKGMPKGTVASYYQLQKVKLPGDEKKIGSLVGLLIADDSMKGKRRVFYVHKGTIDRSVFWPGK